MVFSIYCRLSLLLCTVLSVLSFTPCSTSIRNFGARKAAAFLPTILFSDVSESADTEETVESEAPEPKKRFRKERHTVFVGNLPFETTDGELRDLFSQCGSVEQVSIPIDRESGQQRGFAFVDMSSKEELQVAIDRLGGSEFGGRSIRVTESLPKDQAKKQARKTDAGAQKLYLGNLPFDATREEVEELFSKYGNVREVFFPMDRQTNQPRGFAFLTLDEENAAKAIEETNGIEFLGRPLVVSLPLPPGEKAPRRAAGEPRQKLYIGNLSFYTLPDTLREVFEEFGEVFDCYLPEDPETGGSRGFGFVTMAQDAAEAAIKATDGIEIDGRIIRVNEAQPKGAIQNSADGNDDWSDEDDGGY